MLLKIQNLDQVGFVDVYKHALSPKSWQEKLITDFKSYEYV